MAASRRGRARGFTLIEVIGALVVFSAGVLMVLRLSAVSGTRMREAGISSELAARAAEQLDSLDQLPLSGLTMGVDTDTLTVSGRVYERILTLTPLTPLLARVELSLTPVGGTGTTFAATSYLSEPW